MHVVMDYVVDNKLQAFESLEDDLEDNEVQVLNNPDTVQADGAQLNEEIPG